MNLITFHVHSTRVKCNHVASVRPKSSRVYTPTFAIVIHAAPHIIA